uniref:Uncharacterized protein n=1 Tax=Rhizophora mucronata TaxID=61149 RepID=A0A2P2LYP4_RHIMU
MDISARSHAACDVLVDELESKLGKFSRINNFPELYASDENDNSDAEESEELEPYGPEPVKQCLENGATFPCGSKQSDEGDDEPEMSLWLLFSEEFVQPPHSHTLSMPLVSAMKGSREKQGLSPRNLKVTWAADVYDPIPNSVSHAVKGKQKKSRKDKDNNNHNKKNGKKGQKGNLSKGGSKDKKQFRKHGGRSDKCYRTMDSLDADDVDGLDVGGQDYCGSSFWKKSPSGFHCSVAEAL